MKNNKVGSRIEGLIVDTTPTLIAIAGPLSGYTFCLDEPVVSIGRLPSNDICLQDQFVSRHHSVISKQPDGHIIEDLNSANGTYVNGERVSGGSLEEGSLIEIGASRFLFRLRCPEESMALSQNVIAENDHLSLNDIRSG